jgi:(E)-4-hydroxy-3-methylbut-2-enyl-diphosphate synthase
MLDAKPGTYTEETFQSVLSVLKKDPTVVLCLSSLGIQSTRDVRNMVLLLQDHGIHQPVVMIIDENRPDLSKALIRYSVDSGVLLLEGVIQGLCLGFMFGETGKADKELQQEYAVLNSIAFGILQATRTRISKTEYISCPSCGRTLFDLQETTAKIRAVTNHLKGVKIAIMGCIVNGPGEMADADFGYVGSGVGKITLYKNKDIVKRNIDSEVAVQELIGLLKDNGVWVDPQ